MTAVWQTLIPETPSTEPLSSPLDGLIHPSPSNNSSASGPGPGGSHSHGEGGGGVSTICGSGGASDNLHHRHHNHNNNNNINHSNPHPHLLSKTNSRTSNSAKGGPGINRFASVPYGEQLFR